MSAQPAAAAASRPPRNHVIDTARAASVLIVVVFHSLLYQVRLVDGRPVMIPWAPEHWPWWALSWPFMIIPVFFVAGGYAHALVIDRQRAAGATYGAYLAGRGHRLVGPLLLFVTVVALASSVAAWAGWLSAAVEGTRALMQLLWFISVYLVIVAAAPAAVAAHDRWGWRPMAVLFVAAAAVDAWSFAVDLFWLRNINMLLVWPLVHQLGIAYHRGWFRTGPAWRAWAAVAGGAAGIAVLVFGFGYPGSSVGLADLPIANVQPPTIAMVLLAVAQCGVLGLVEASGLLARVPRRLEWLLGAVNALMMSVYLWHIGAIAIAAGLLLAISVAAPAASGVALAQPTVAALTLVVVVLVVPQIARLEVRLIAPLGATPDTAEAVAAYGVLVAGTGLVWQAGTVIHPAAPLSTAGVLLVWAGVWLMRRAAGARRRPRP
nr:acyltransferase family protein [Propionibacterium sp.]